MENFIIIIILLCIIGCIGYYLYKMRKQGQVCIGCPCSKQCSGKHCNHCQDMKQISKNFYEDKVSM